MMTTETAQAAPTLPRDAQSIVDSQSNFEWIICVDSCYAVHVIRQPKHYPLNIDPDFADVPKHIDLDPGMYSIEFKYHIRKDLFGREHYSLIEDKILPICTARAWVNEQ